MLQNWDCGSREITFINENHLLRSIIESHAAKKNSIMQLLFHTETSSNAKCVPHVSQVPIVNKSTSSRPDTDIKVTTHVLFSISTIPTNGPEISSMRFLSAQAFRDGSKNSSADLLPSSKVTHLLVCAAA
jgi:hypothetical protein